MIGDSSIDQIVSPFSTNSPPHNAQSVDEGWTHVSPSRVVHLRTLFRKLCGNKLTTLR